MTVKKIELDWGETGLIPNSGNSFSHPDRDIDFLWAEDDPKDP